MIAIQIKKFKFYYIKRIIIPLRSASLKPISPGPASAGLFDDGTGAAIEIDEGASASEVDSECERHCLSSGAIPAIHNI